MSSRPAPASRRPTLDVDVQHKIRWALDHQQQQLHADAIGLIMPAPDDLATGSTVFTSDDDDIAVMEATVARGFRAKSWVYSEMKTPVGTTQGALDDDIAPLGRTLDVGQVLSRQRHAQLGGNPVIVASEHRVLSTLAILSLCFFIVSGGPASTESAVASGGPLLGLVGYVVIPLVFNLPITLAIAELCSAFPEDGGFAMWILNAWGPFWGFLEGYWAWVRSILDRVLYVQLLYAYLFGDALGLSIGSGVVRYVIKAALAVLLTLPSLVGIRLIVFILSTLLAVVCLVYFVFTCWGLAETRSTVQFGDIRLSTISLPHANASAVLSGGWDVHFPFYVNSLFWNFDGFYLASVFGGEVSNPAWTYPRAFLLSFVLMWLCYVLPTLAAVGVNLPHWSTWDDGAYADVIAFEIGGSALHTITLLGVVAGLAGMYMAELFCEAYQISGMAECGLAPLAFQKRDQRFAMPRVPIVFSLAVVLIVVAFDIESISDVANAFSAVVELLIIATVIKLRKTLSFVPRPTKVPGGILVLCVVLLPPSLLLGFLLVHTLLDPVLALVFAVVTVVGVVCAYLQRKRLQHRHAGG